MTDDKRAQIDRLTSTIVYEAEQEAQYDTKLQKKLIGNRLARAFILDAEQKEPDNLNKQKEIIAHQAAVLEVNAESKE